MALALYLVPILLQVVASRVHHHHRDEHDVQDKLAELDLADILIPILSKQELEYKANNQSNKNIHALKKLIEKSHVAIILAKPQDKGDNHSIDSRNASFVEEENPEHIIKRKSNVLENDKKLKHPNTSSVKIGNKKHFELQSSLSPDLVSPGQEDTKLNNLGKSGFNTKHEDFNNKNSPDDVTHENVSQKEFYEKEDEEIIETHLKNLLDSKDENSDSDEKDIVTDNLQRYLESKKSLEDNLHEVAKQNDEDKHSQENNVSFKNEYKEKGFDLLQDISNSDSESSESYEYKEKEEQINDIKLLKNKLNFRDKYFETYENIVDAENDYIKSGLSLKHKDTQEENSQKKVKHNEGNKYSQENLYSLLYPSEASLGCYEEDGIEEHDSLHKDMGLARLGSNLHIYDRHDSGKEHNGGVHNLFFYFA